LRFFGTTLGRRLGVRISIPRGAPRDDVPIHFICRRVRACPSQQRVVLIEQALHQPIDALQRF
jgi:hypothetical protein